MSTGLHDSASVALIRFDAIVLLAHMQVKVIDIPCLLSKSMVSNASLMRSDLACSRNNNSAYKRANSAVTMSSFADSS